MAIAKHNRSAVFALRDYQKKCIDAIECEFEKRQTQLVQLPTGSGKTVILWSFLKRHNLCSLIVAPTRDLIEQLYETGCNFVDKKDIYLKKRSDYVKRKHTITTMQGLTWMIKKNKGHCLDFDILIIDEAHRSQAKTYREFIEKYIEGTSRKCLGLTATPERLDGKSLIDIFEIISFKRSLIDLIRKKHLTDIKYFKIKTDVKMVDLVYRAGDFSSANLKQLDTPKRNGIIVDIVLKKIKNKKTLVFCLSVEHAKFVAALLCEKGIKSCAIYGTLCMTKRREILDRFKRGEIQVLTNCQLLTEGFDEPSIEVMILARPTRSKALYCQMIGRGVRPFKNKCFCDVYDLSDVNFNITSFNALGDLPEDISFGEEFEGTTLLENVDKFKRGTFDVAESEVVFEEKDLLKESFNEKVLKHQTLLLKEKKIPCWEDFLTIKDAAYLLWKDRKFEEYGIDRKKAWEGWLCMESKA